MPRRLCTTDHAALAPKLGRLDSSQANPGRHTCAGCAWEDGYRRGLIDAERAWKKKVATLMEQVRGWATERGEDARTLPR